MSKTEKNKTKSEELKEPENTETNNNETETEESSGNPTPEKENDGSEDVKAAEAPEENKAEENPNITMVSDLQPKRSKPGYPQELKNAKGFGYNP